MAASIMDTKLQILILVSAFVCCLCGQHRSLDDGLLVLTIATDHNDGLQRLLDSAKLFNYDVQIVGMGEKWSGGNMDYAGGGQKVNMLKNALEMYKDREDLLIMFVDAYDVILTADYKEVLEKYKKFDSNVVFSAEGYCWPDRTLHTMYPKTKATEYRYLNSGGFIGRAGSLYKLVTAFLIDDGDDDQLYYTRIYLDQDSRAEIGIALDTRAEIFQNLNGALGDVELKYKDSHGYMYNRKTGTHSIVVHGNGPIKSVFSSLANYLNDGWNPNTGCQSCQRDTISLKDIDESDYPNIVLGVFVPYGTPFLRRFFDLILSLDYPKKKIDLYVYNAEPTHANVAADFIDSVKNTYASTKLIQPNEGMLIAEAKNGALEECLKRDCQYYMYMDSETRITNTQTLKMLIEQNRTVLTPKMSRIGKMWSNFWGAVRQDGYYARSSDYSDIVNGERKGLWNVPYIGNSYLLHASILPRIRNAYTKSGIEEDTDINFASKLRNIGIFMRVTNLEYFGYLIDPEQFDKSRKNPDMYEIFSNKYDWEMEYISPELINVLKKETKIEEPCPDVYWFPLMSPRFCKELIEECEHFGKWSSGGHAGAKDERLGSGYEAVPTVDIHMNQLKFEQHWLQFLREYVQPVQIKLYEGYYHDPPTAVMNFVVRYRPGEQDHLKPHNDASTYTINVGLNTPDVDYEGGGVRFLRYDCRVITTKLGWALIHPGRLTHHHEGLKTTNGTRYIMVSFVDP